MKERKKDEGNDGVQAPTLGSDCPDLCSVITEKEKRQLEVSSRESETKGKRNGGKGREERTGIVVDGCRSTRTNRGLVSFQPPSHRVNNPPPSPHQAEMELKRLTRESREPSRLPLAPERSRRSTGSSILGSTPAVPLRVHSTSVVSRSLLLRVPTELSSRSRVVASHLGFPRKGVASVASLIGRVVVVLGIVSGGFLSWVLGRSVGWL